MIWWTSRFKWFDLFFVIPTLILKIVRIQKEVICRVLQIPNSAATLRLLYKIALQIILLH